MRLYLIRHAQTAWNVAGRAQGHTDEPLDATGRDQAEQLANSFRATSLDIIFSSDLARCQETAIALAQRSGTPLELIPEIRERSFGEWEGLPYDDVRQQLLELAIVQGTDTYEVRPAGGESPKDVWERTRRFMADLNEMQHENVAVVSHGGTCGILLAQMLKGTHESARSFRFGNTAVTQLLRRSDRVWQLERYADSSHLETMGAPMIDVETTKRA